MQSSFTAQSDGTYVGNIRTRREPTEVTFALGSYRYFALLAHLRELFLDQYLPRGAEDAQVSEAPRLQGGGLRGGEDPGEGTPGSDDALPGTEDGIQAVALELRAEVEAERAADAWAEAAAAGDLAATEETLGTTRAPYTPEDLAGAGETASRIAGQGARSGTFGAGAAGAGGGGGPPRCGLPSPGLTRGHTPGGGGTGPYRGPGPGGGGGGLARGGGTALGGAGGGPPGGLPIAQPGLRLDIPAIIAATATAVAAAAAQGYAASSQPLPAASGGGARGLTPMKILHIRFVCGVATDAEVPVIWQEVAQAPTKGASLSILNQYLWAAREVFRRQLFGAEDMMHVCGDLFMFVHGDRFMNPGADPACPAGGLSFWSTRHGAGVLREEIA